MRIGVSLTHKQMASLMGTTSVTVTGVLKRLREHGDIFFTDHRVVVPDMERLMQAFSKRP
ncbi:MULTISPECIES: helix-turn-helix domain-containing protein [Achromobacter]|uniref:helix-turn-helix domain-containing protein n=1 Tax=Achromobacter TaxID=222 RepID=UPI000A45CD31|nr:MULTISPECIES: helix-turn-helix domain-containing protein [Achromobacter]